MTPTEAADFLRSYNKWRIFGGLKKPSPGEISKSFYAVIDMIDRLEAAEGERDELRASKLPEGLETDLFIVEHAMRMNNWDWNSDTSDDLKRSAYKIISELLAAQEDKP